MALYCFTILRSTSIDIHSVKQHLLTNWPGSDAATSCAKDYKGHSLLQTSFNEPPNSIRIDAEKLFSQFKLNRRITERVLHEFDKYFIPTNGVYEHATFHRKSQQVGESIEDTFAAT